MNFLDRSPPHHLGGALRVLNPHAQQQLHDGVKHAAEKPSLPRLALMQHRAWQPARANDTIGLRGQTHQFAEGFRSGRAVGIHVTDQVRGGRQFQAFDERAAFADGIGEVQRADFRMVFGDAVHDA